MRANNCHQNVSVVCIIEIIFTDLNDIERSPTIPLTTVLQPYGYSHILAHPKCSRYGICSFLGQNPPFSVVAGGHQWNPMASRGLW